MLGDWLILFIPKINSSLLSPGILQKFVFRKYYHANHGLIVNWRGEYKTSDIELISHLAGIPVSSGEPYPMSLADYLPLMGNNCESPEMGGIKATTFYRNIYIVGRWVCSNIIGTSNTSSFYDTTLHVVHSLMSFNYKYCMCRQLYRTIAHSKNRLDSQENAFILLPCLITRIC